MKKINQNNSDLTKSLKSPLLSTKLTNLLYESSLLIIVTILLYLILILLTYSHKDPGWFIVSTISQLHNWGGYVGAWLADLLLFIFGISAWWWCVFLLNIICRCYQRISTRFISKRVEVKIHNESLIRIVGFICLLIGSLGIEYMYDITVKILHIPGSMFGRIISNIAQIWFGFTGAILFLLLFFILGCGLFFQISWLTMIRYLSSLLTKYVLLLKKTYFVSKNCNLSDMMKFKYKKFILSQSSKFIKKETIDIESQVINKIKLTHMKNQKNDNSFRYINNINLPSLSLLDNSLLRQKNVSAEILESTSRLIEKKISNFGIQVKVVAVYPGPVITRYEVQLAIGIKSSQILGLARDLARSLSLSSVRVIEVIPGKECIGLELPNLQRHTIRLIEILDSKAYRDSTSSITVALGKDICGNSVIADLSQMPHLLIAGTTGSGKSIGIHAIILSILYKSTPKQVNLILIDPKMVELSVYQDIPHLLTPVITDMHQATCVLKWAVAEMERRLKYMAVLGVRNLQAYNYKINSENWHHTKKIVSLNSIQNIPTSFQQFQTIVIIIDELADLMMVAGKNIEELIIRIAQKARATGIHLVLATQRPSVDVITGLIKANMPARIAFQLNSKIDSRIILDQIGAETLLGMGDMLYMPPGIRLPIRIHGAFISDKEICRVVNYLKRQGIPNYIDDLLKH